MCWHESGPDAAYDLSSIRLIGTVGEAVNPEAWNWARTHIGRDTPAGVPMVDTWWQSETGSTIISPRQTDTTFKPGSGSRPLPGVNVAVVDEAGNTAATIEQCVIVVTLLGPVAALTV